MKEGFIITEGIAYAPAVIFKNEAVSVEHKIINDDEVEKEINLYQEAKERTSLIFKNEEVLAQSELAKEFIETAILYLIDPYISEQIINCIKNSHLCAESAIINSYQEYIDQLISNDDPFVIHNEFEIRNIAEALILELHKKKVVLPTITDNCILVCNNITPAQFLTLDTDKIKGILLEDGNTNSHIAIVLRSSKIPAIFNVANATKVIHDGTNVLIDAYNNHIYLEPLEEIIWSVQQKAKQIAKNNENITPMIAQYKTLNNGRTIKVLANIGSISELNTLNHIPSSAVGLFRTEFLFMNYTKEPSEEEQFITYKQILSSLPQNYSVTFRTFDFTADKLPLYMTNQSLFSVGHNTIGNTATHMVVRQLRAMLRASTYGSMRIMFPMVSEYEEVKSLFEIVEEIKDNLIKDGIEVANVPIGIMIETPAGAIMSEDLASIADFFSIGTNDLTQYTEATSREAANHRNNELTPAVLKLINYTVKNALKSKIDICICGELVHNIDYIPLLLAIGLSKFSVAPFYLAKVLETIHQTELKIPDNFDEILAKIRTREEILELSKRLIAKN